MTEIKGAFVRTRPSACQKYIFDMLAEGKGASKTSKPRPSAYRWYGRGRFAQEVKMLSEGNCMLRRKTCVLTVGGFFDILKGAFV